MRAPDDKPKATKAQANYRLGTATRQCARCTMFRAPAACTAVAGTILRGALCDYFKRK